MNTLLVISIIAFLGFCAEVQSINIYETGVSHEDQQLIVDDHNNCRLQIAAGSVPNQPKGINLKRMSWDAKLAEEAQKIADTCIFEHVTVKDERFPASWVGQNLYMSKSTGNSSTPSWTDGINSWFNEYKNYDYQNGAHTGVVGHYTQVVWADTNLIGCGFTYFYDDTDAYKFIQLYVCNYGPGGNWAGQKPYLTGESGCENLC